VGETGWKDSFAEDSLTSVENVVSGTGEIGEVANVYWHVQLRLCDGDDGARWWSVARVGGKGALDGGSDEATCWWAESGEVIQGGLRGSISIGEELLHDFGPTFVKVDKERSAIPSKSPASKRTSRNITSLPIRVTAAGAGCEDDDAIPKGMLASEKWWAYESSAILLLPTFTFGDDT
jgi:hypothetical protein